MDKDLYEIFAYDYDEFGTIDQYIGDEMSFFEKIFEKNNINTVLDCACGTGHHLYMFSEMGFSVTGSDYSKSMLEVASKNLKKYGKVVPLFQCDFRYLEQKHQDKFDAIVCLTTALPHLHTDEDLIKALSSMKNRLNKNGILVLTQGTTHYTLKLPSIQVIINREDFSRIFVTNYDNKLQTIHVLDLFHSENRLENNQYDIIYRLLLDNEYRQLLSKAGFENIQIYGDYLMDNYDENSKRLIVVANNV
jgi:ubiquinone/menaquinone biosynthesis C-methylase UbiE